LHAIRVDARARRAACVFSHSRCQSSPGWGPRGAGRIHLEPAPSERRSNGGGLLDQSLTFSHRARRGRTDRGDRTTPSVGSASNPSRTRRVPGRSDGSSRSELLAASCRTMSSSGTMCLRTTWTKCPVNAAPIRVKVDQCSNHVDLCPQFRRERNAMRDFRSSRRTWVALLANPTPSLRAAMRPPASGKHQFTILIVQLIPDLHGEHSRGRQNTDGRPVAIYARTDVVV